MLTCFNVQKHILFQILYIIVRPLSNASFLENPSKCLNRLYLTVFSSLRSSLLLVHLFLSKFFVPVNFACNMLWYSTPWTATPFCSDTLWLTLLVEGVNDHLLGHCQVSSSPLLWFQRTRDTRNLYSMDGHLLKVKCKQSNILRNWFLTFISCKL